MRAMENNMKLNNNLRKLLWPLAIATCTLTSSLFAVEPTPSEQSARQRAVDLQAAQADSLTLVFQDDFSTDPNTNGLWTIIAGRATFSARQPGIRRLTFGI